MRISSTAAIYDVVVAELFLRLKKELGHGKHQYDFEKTALEILSAELRAAKKIAKGIKNIADIKYTYDARKDFPATIASDGFWAIVGRGKGKYSLVRLAQNNLIRIPQDLPIKGNTLKVKDTTPEPVKRVLGEDEQSTFTRVRYNELLGSFLKMKVFQVQSHERTTVSAGQIEVDEIYVGTGNNGKAYVIPISGKGGDKDCLSYTQALNLNLYGAEKARYKGLEVIPVGVVKKADGIWFVKFSTEVDIRKIRIVEVGTFILERT